MHACPHVACAGGNIPPSGLGWVGEGEEAKIVPNRTKVTYLMCPLISASKVDATREPLARWDASARAWLQTADEAKESAQKAVAAYYRQSRSHCQR